MKNQEQDKDTPKEKTHPVILKLAKIALKDYLINLPEGRAICHEHIKMVLQIKSIDLRPCDIAELMLPMLCGKNKVREFRFWFRKMREEDKTDCLTIFTPLADDPSKSLQEDEGEKNE